MEALYYATATDIIGVFTDGNHTTTILAGLDGPKMYFDSITRKLIYDDGGDFVSVNLDGSSPETIKSGLSTLRFTVDPLTRTIYYITNLFRTIRQIDIDGQTVSTVSTGSLGSKVDNIGWDPSDR